MGERVMDEWMDGWMEGWNNIGMDGWVYERVDGCMGDGWKD